MSREGIAKTLSTCALCYVMDKAELSDMYVRSTDMGDFYTCFKCGSTYSERSVHEVGREVKMGARQ